MMVLRAAALAASLLIVATPSSANPYLHSASDKPQVMTPGLEDVPLRGSRHARGQGRTQGCPARAWCGCYLANVFGFTGVKARTLWLARNWASMFERTHAREGAVAVFARGRGGHVGRVDGVRAGEILLTSGNDGNAVRTRWRSTRGIIAYVDPHAPKSSRLAGGW